MEQKIHDYFESETMPEPCVRRIEKALTEKLPRRTGVIRWAAAAVLLVLVIVNWEAIRVEAEEIYDRIIHAVAPELEGKVGEVAPGTEKWFIGAITRRSADGETVVEIPVSEMDAKLFEVRQGRIFFIANGEDMDITEQCSDNEAFIYTVEDNLGKLHYLIVGGTPENCGGIEAIYDPAKDAWTQFAYDFSLRTGTGTPDWERNAMIGLGVYSMEQTQTLSELIPLGNIGEFCQVREGRLYFTGDGQNIDITDQCSDDVPFVYSVQEGDILYYMAVGGTPERNGTMKTYYDLSTEKWGLLGAKSYILEDGSTPAWLEQAKTEIGYK